MKGGSFMTDGSRRRCLRAKSGRVGLVLRHGRDTAGIISGAWSIAGGDCGARGFGDFH